MQIFSGQQWQLLSDLHHFLFAKFIYKDDNWLLMLFEHTSCWIVSLCVFVCLCVWLYFCGFWSEPRTRQSVKEIKKRRKSVAWPELFIVFKMVQHTEVWRPIQYMHMCVCVCLSLFMADPQCEGCGTHCIEAENPLIYYGILSVSCAVSRLHIENRNTGFQRSLS